MNIVEMCVYINYGSFSWTLDKECDRRIENAEMQIYGIEVHV